MMHIATKGSRLDINIQSQVVTISFSADLNWLVATAIILAKLYFRFRVATV